MRSATTAALRAAGHETSLVFDPVLFEDTFLNIPRLAGFFRDSAKVVREVERERPDLVLFSVTTDNFPWFVRTAREVKRSLGVPIVAGGIHCTSVPERVLAGSETDYVIRGEGEEAIVELVRALEEGRPVEGIANLAYRKGAEFVVNDLRPLIADLESLPFPDKSIYDHTPLKADDFYTLQSSRGCMFSCSYCHNSLEKGLYQGKGPFLRRRRVEHVIEEIEEARRRYRFTTVNFLDEVFAFDKEWVSRFADEYPRRIGLPFLCCAHPAYMDDEMARLLKKAGCIKVDLGVQSLDEATKKQLLNRSETNLDVARAIRALRDHGVTVYAENIVNLPLQTEKHVAEMGRFYLKHRPDIPKFFWLRYYPGTPIVETGRELGLVSAEKIREIEEGQGSGSIAGGGTLKNEGIRRVFNFLILMPYLPISVADFILRTGAYRYLPSGFLQKNFLAFERILDRKDARIEVVVERHKRVYFYYLSQWFKDNLMPRSKQ